MDKCVGCGFAFVNPRPTMDFLLSYYSSGQHAGSTGEAPRLNSILEQERLFPNSSADAVRIIRTVCHLLSQSQPLSRRRLMDVGCGYGFFAAEALRNGFEVTALEMAPVERSIAEQMTGIKPIPAAFEDFECPSQTYSAMLMSQVLEHALDVNLWMSKANAFLEKEGILAIALPNFMSLFRLVLQEREPYICPPAHLNFFSRRSLSSLVCSHGFQVCRVQWVSRIPPGAFQKRLAKLGRALPMLFARISPVALQALDRLRLGMFLNLYARKLDTGVTDTNFVGVVKQ